MKIKELQKEIDVLDARIAKHFAQTRGGERAQTLMLKLGEEYGELCEAMLARVGFQRKEKLEKSSAGDVGDELADVIVTALALAVNLDLDIEEIINDELGTVRERFGK